MNVLLWLRAFTKICQTDEQREDDLRERGFEYHDRHTLQASDSARIFEYEDDLKEPRSSLIRVETLINGQKTLGSVVGGDTFAVPAGMEARLMCVWIKERK